MMIDLITDDTNPECDQLFEEMRDKIFESLGCSLIKPSEGKQVYISSTDMNDSTFVKIIKEYLKEK